METLTKSNNPPLSVLIDTNVAITYITNRDDIYSHEIVELFHLCSIRYIHGCLAFHSLSIIWYVLRKIEAKRRREWLEILCQVLTIASSTNQNILDAIRQDSFPDFEDCLQDKCALSAHCDYIVTSNIEDFYHSETPAVTPKDFLKVYYEHYK